MINKIITGITIVLVSIMTNTEELKKTYYGVSIFKMAIEFVSKKEENKKLKTDTR